MVGVGETRERSRWHTNTRGRFPGYAPTNKLRARLAAGAGEAMAVQQAANKLFRTQSELAPVPRRVHTLADVVHGLGLPNADQQQVQRLVSDIPASWTQKTQTQRSFLARGRLVETLRAMKHIPSETRQEIVKRAGAYWKATMQVDYGKAPTVRYIARKSMTDMAHTLPISKVLVPGRDIPATGRTSQAKRAMEYYLTKAKKGEAAKGQHKYEQRKPDGHGGWLYKYPGEGWSTGKGAHEGTTNAMPGEHLDPHHKGFQPSIEKQKGGGFTLHAGEGVTSEFKPGMSLADHKAQWDHHKAAHGKAKEAGNHAAAKAHEHALSAHAQAHNMKQEKMRGEGDGPPAPTPGKPVPPKPSAAAGGGAGAEPPGEDLGGPAQPPEGGNEPATDGGQPAPGNPGQPPGAESDAPPVGPDGQEPEMDNGAPPPTGESAALAEGRTRHTEMHPDVQAVQTALGNATKVMSDMVAGQMHMGEVKERIKAVKADKSLPKAMRKRMIAQHEAEIAASKADVAKLTEHHDTVMAEAQRAQAMLKKPHPILQALLKIFAKMRPEKVDADTKAQTDKGIDPHEAHQGKRTHADAAAEQDNVDMQHVEQQQAEAEAGPPPPPTSIGKQKPPTQQQAQKLAASFAGVARVAVDELQKGYTSNDNPYPNGPAYTALPADEKLLAMIRAEYNKHTSATPAVPGAVPVLSKAAPLRHVISLHHASTENPTGSTQSVDNGFESSRPSALVRDELRDAVADKLVFVIPVEQ